MDTLATDPEAWLARWRDAHDAEALGNLLKWQRDRACALATGILGEPADADDAVQQACIKLLSRRRGFEDRRAFEQAVTRAVVQCSIDQLRSRRSRGRRHQEVAAMHQETITPDDRVVAHEQQRAIREALHELADDERIAVVLCCQDGHSVSGAAAILELPRETLRARLKRGLRRLRGLLAARGIHATTALVASGLAATAHAAGPALCRGLDAALPGAPCAGLPAAGAAAGPGAGVAALATGGGLAGVLTGAAPVAVALAIATTVGLAVHAGTATDPTRDGPSVATATEHPPIERTDPMNRKTLANATAAAALAAAAATPATAEEEVAIADLPPAVVATATAVQGAKIVEAEREDEGGRVVYEVEVVAGSTEWEYLISANGALMKTTQEVPIDEVPEAIMAAAKKKQRGVWFTEAEKSSNDAGVVWTLEGANERGKEFEVEVGPGEVQADANQKSNGADGF